MLSYRAIGVFHPEYDVVLHEDEYDELTELLDYALTPALGCIIENNKNADVRDMAQIFLELLEHWNDKIEYGVPGFDVRKGSLSVYRGSAEKLKRRTQWAIRWFKETLRDAEDLDAIDREFYEYPSHPDRVSIERGLDMIVVMMDSLLNQKINYNTKTGKLIGKRGR